MQSDIFLALIGVFVAVAACCGAGLYVWNSRVSPERRRLAELAGQHAAGSGAVRPVAIVLDTTSAPDTPLRRFRFSKRPRAPRPPSTHRSPVQNSPSERVSVWDPS